MKRKLLSIKRNKEINRGAFKTFDDATAWTSSFIKQNKLTSDEVQFYLERDGTWSVSFDSIVTEKRLETNAEFATRVANELRKRDMNLSRFFSEANPLELDTNKLIAFGKTWEIEDE